MTTESAAAPTTAASAMTETQVEDMRTSLRLGAQPFTKEAISNLCDLALSALRSGTFAEGYEAVADAVNEVAEEANTAFLQAGLTPGEWDGDDIVNDVKRGIANDIERLAATAKEPPSATRPSYTAIVQAVARGWCSPRNSHKEMDADLASSIAVEVDQLLGRADDGAKLKEG